MRIRPTCLPLPWLLAALGRMEFESFFHLHGCSSTYFITESNQKSINAMIHYQVSQALELSGEAECCLLKGLSNPGIQSFGSNF